MKLYNAMISSITFFTTIPFKKNHWDEESNKYIPLFIPFVGIIISLFFALLLYGLEFLDVSSLFKAIIIIIYFVLITGGLHLDAFMDTCDAHFSRRDMKRKLEIMKDSNIGAFAAVYLVVLFLLKLAFVNEYLQNDFPLLILLVIPFILRLMQSFLLLNTQFATENGLAKMFGTESRKKQYVYVLYFLGGLIVSYYLLDLYFTLFLFLISLLYLLVYRRFAIKQFGGITGDVIGAYIEIVEMIMFGGALLYGLLYWG